MGRVLHEPASDAERQPRDLAGHAVTRAQQIDAALKVLAPPRYERTHCRSNIEYMLDNVQAFSGTSAELRATRSKRTARAWRSYHLAVVRLRATHIALLATGWGGFIELADIERAMQKTTPEECDARRRAQESWVSLGGVRNAPSRTLTICSRSGAATRSSSPPAEENGGGWQRYFMVSPTPTCFVICEPSPNTAGSKRCQHVFNSWS